MDIKTPGSKESSRNRLDNLTYIQHKDQIKFVICDEQDYQWSRDLIRSYDLTDKCEVLMSPSYGHMESAELAGWILRDHLPVRFQLQLHKILWGDEPGR
jgi:7-carboxy-7-deazaguanine synthase